MPPIPDATRQRLSPGLPAAPGNDHYRGTSEGCSARGSRTTQDRSVNDWQAAGQAVSLVSGKWTVPVLNELRKSPRNYNELARAVGTDHKTLARTLQRLQADNLVLRESQGRQRVIYQLSPRAREITSLLEALARWWQSTMA
jgi:DNA-binding HxlR family transcriptional regulator